MLREEAVSVADQLMRIAKPLLWIVGAIAVAIVAFQLAWFWATYSTTKAIHTRAEPLVAEIEKEIPPGTSRADVEARLSSLGIATSGAYFPVLGAADRQLFPGASGVIQAYTEWMGSKLYSCRIRLTFMFDASGRLIRFSHRPECDAWFG
jgi:hypothetical protein